MQLQKMDNVAICTSESDTVTTAVEAITQRFETAKKNVEGFYGRFNVHVSETDDSTIYSGLLEMAINWYLDELDIEQLSYLCRSCLTHEDPSEILVGICMWSFTHIVRIISTHSSMKVDEEKNALKVKLGEKEYLFYPITDSDTKSAEIRCSSAVREKIANSNFSADAKEFFLRDIDRLFYLLAKPEPCEKSEFRP